RPLMKKHILALLLVLSSSAAAQTSNGSLTGLVRDSQGAVIPGATVTAQGSDATFNFTTERDGLFRFLNLEPGTYHVTVELSGFQTGVRDVIVALGKNADVAFDLKLSQIVENVTVTAAPPIVDARSTSTSTTFSKDELTKVPTSRDPFSLVRAVPGVLLDRVNIGGNETGQAPAMVAKGTRPQDTVYTL